MDWVDVVGWVGAALVLVAYGMVSTGRLHGHSVPYQILNVLGGVGMLINGYARGAFPSAAVNVIWIGIGMYILIRQARRPAAS